MYLFTLTYPLLVLAMYTALHVVSGDMIHKLIKTFWILWILPIPVLALLMRIAYSNIAQTLGWHSFFYLFIHIFVLPLSLFIYLLILVRTLYTDEKNNITRAHGISVILGISSSIVYTYLHLIVNNALFSWVDILIFPLISMSLVQAFISVGPRVLTMRKGNLRIINFFIICLCGISFGTLATWTMIWSRESLFTKGKIPLIMVVLIGYILMITQAKIVLRKKQIVPTTFVSKTSE